MAAAIARPTHAPDGVVTEVLVRPVVLPLVLLALLSGVAPPATAQWHQFRGPQAGVAADNPDLPETWSATDNVAWKADVPGLGWSSPVVWNGHVFLTSAVSTGDEPKALPGLYDPGDEQGKTKSTSVQHWTVFDFDAATGKLRWSTELKSGLPPMLRHLKNSFASETPTTDGERVYVFFGAIGLVAALDFNGKVVWSKELGAFNGQQEFAPAASPVLHQGRLFVVNDNTTKSYLAAFDAKSGTQLWRIEREEVENWATPFVWVNDRRTELVTNGGFETIDAAGPPVNFGTWSETRGGADTITDPGSGYLGSHSATLTYVDSGSTYIGNAITTRINTIGYLNDPIGFIVSLAGTPISIIADMTITRPARTLFCQNFIRNLFASFINPR